MNFLRKLMFLLTLIVFNISFSQENPSKEEKAKKNKVLEKVDDTNKTIKNTNETIKNTVQDTKSTVNDLKETIGSIFPRKNKDKLKRVITIQITQITYGNLHLNNLYNYISKSKGVKKPSKKFENGTALINVNYKKSADDLWQNVPENLRKSFKIVKMNENNIFLNLIEQTPAASSEKS